MIPKDNPLPLSLTSLLLTLALSLSASPTQRGDVEARDIAQSLDALRIELSLHADRNRQQEIRRDSTGTQTTDYAIDQDDRLIGNTVTDASGSVTTTAYTLDGVGNRLHETVQRNGSTLSDITYHYQAQHRLIDTHDLISGLVTEYTYDERGQLISETTNGQTTTYRPNAQDRLATLTLPGAPPVDYRYDPEGKRVERRTATDLTRYGWDGPHLRRETNVANNLLDSHDWAAGHLLQSRHLTTTLYAQHDAQGSPTRWSAAQGQEQGQLHYDAWGKTTATSPDLPRIAYTGHYRDPEDDRYYAQQRDYRPSLGRFTRIDPWEGDPLHPITLNKYLYANGNPLYYTDPTGMYGQFFDGTWNDDRPETIAAGTQTNVYRLSRLYDREIGGAVDYQRGVGTSWISKVPGGATGLGARSRINIAYENLVTWYNSPEARDMRANDPERWEQARQIDVFGFSRGAVQAREFANVVKERGIPNRETGDNFEGVNVRFLGLFDTVGSMGVPGNNVNLTYDLSVDPDFVRNARHAVAADEFRLQFDLSSIGASDGEMASEGFEERYFRGAHSDIGGGHAAGSQGKPNSLARATLRWMHREASEAGVPLKAIFGDDSSVPDFSQFSEDEARALLIHDSRRGVTGTLERLINRQRRTIYYSDGRKASVSRAELIERAREDDRSEAEVVKEGDGQLILEPVQGDD